MKTGGTLPNQTVLFHVASKMQTKDSNKDNEIGQDKSKPSQFKTWQPNFKAFQTALLIHTMHLICHMAATEGCHYHSTNSVNNERQEFP